MVIAPREEGLAEKTAEETHLFPWYEHVGTHGIPKKDVSTNNEGWYLPIRFGRKTDTFTRR